MAENIKSIFDRHGKHIKFDKQLLKQKSWLHRRLVNAYPNFRFEKSI